MVYTHTPTVECYSAIKIKQNNNNNNKKKNEMLSLSTTWMDLEGVMPSKTRHTEKDKYHTVLFTCGTSEIK